MSASLSAALARSRRHLPSKRKLDDTTASPSSTSSISRTCLVSNPSSNAFPSSSLVMPPLHFFVRTSSKTLVVHAHPSDDVNSVIERFCRQSPTSDYRLIYQGRQLQGEDTLASCKVQPDSLLHLTARLRSTRCPRAWQLANDICHPRDPYLLDSLVKEFLSLCRMQTPEKELSDHLDVFLLSGAPVALVKFYLSHTSAPVRVVADRSIRLFTHDPNQQKESQVKCLPIILEFCRLLSSTAGRRDLLYQSCRGTVATLLDFQECRTVGPFCQPASAIPQLLPFAKEMAEIIIAGLSSESMLISSKDLTEFSRFMRALRMQIQDWMGGVGPMPRVLYYSNLNACSTSSSSSSSSNNTHRQLDGWIHALYSTYRELIEKVNWCLKKLNTDLTYGKNVVGESDTHLLGPSCILLVLTELNHFSDIYEDAETTLLSVLTAHRVPLNALVRHAKRQESFCWLLKHRDILDFESRRNLALMMFPEGRDDYHELHEMLIDRSQLLAESFEYITQADASSLHGGLFMEFKNEEATGPGVLREWFCLVCRAIFSPQNVLFLPCANDKRRFFPNPASCVDPLHLKYFVFSGRIIALALMHRVQVGVVFDRIFYSQLSGRTITLEDIKDADPLLYASCRKILEMDPDILDSDALGLTFIREVDELGSHKVIELCPGGKDLSVNSKNRDVYINLLIQDRFVNSTSKQVAHFAQGFGDILTNAKEQKFFFSNLDLEDFDRMIGGSEGAVDVKDWKAHTEYNGYKLKDRQIGWFWKVVEQMPPEKQRMLLFFWTSVKYLPAEGFGGLGSKLYIYKSSESQNRLPSSHTCFYRLCLPAYSSLSTMRSRLSMITQDHVSCTFGTW
ncbi:E3 ubiquitin-protein ligase UPL5-like protein [Carex littledalei]|uniref:HECT-type E3 ubiquitin transferase n=1 Tax=Carex littledalei TaxID=544730 RepID=A0A833R785_9POAL|nr:E3 ubiquitin-protein ligase UPL5-like protein [Carex littledalei]